MLQFPGVFISVQQLSSEGPIRHKFFFSANRLSKYGILMLVKSRQLVIFPRTSLDDLVQESPPQVSHFIHMLMFSAFLAFGHSLF
jgi:hypothetical protein